MVSTNTIDGLREDLEDLEKQEEKAEDKYQSIHRRANAVRDALHILQQDAG